MNSTHVLPKEYITYFNQGKRQIWGHVNDNQLISL